MTRSMLLTPRIPTAGRSVLHKGRDASPYLVALCLVPAMGFAIALADRRIGFRLFMASLALAILMLVVSLYARSRALRTGEVRIAAEGDLHFVPPRYLRTATVVFFVTFLFPAVVVILIKTLGLPTQPTNTRLGSTGPYFIALFALGSLVHMAWSARVPVGLRLTAEGLSGVRGTGQVDVGWHELTEASTVGPHGPKLVLSTRAPSWILLDAHQLGSDPAIVAAVIEHYRTHPEQRTELRDGAAALRAVEYAANSD